MNIGVFNPFFSSQAEKKNLNLNHQRGAWNPKQPFMNGWPWGSRCEPGMQLKGPPSVATARLREGPVSGPKNRSRNYALMSCHCCCLHLSFRHRSLEFSAEMSFSMLFAVYRG